jgi:hypothetical protein
LGYYMRYIVADEQPVSLEDVGKAFAKAGVEYDVDGEETEVTITYQGRPIGHVTLNVPGDGLFEEERDELIEFAEEGNEAQKRRVIDMLRAAREIVAVQVLFGNGDTGWTLDRLSPLWIWLQSNRRGLVQADGEGYYDGHDLILPLG